jgi:hypothetical protein
MLLWNGASTVDASPQAIITRLISAIKRDFIFIEVSH